ncbi:MAG: hypothetical protein WBQ54_13275 [Pseudolabrys sp.]
MLTRTKRVTLTFQHPFSLKGVDRRLVAGEYEVTTDEELIEGLSFPVYRRVATLIFLPADAGQQASMEMINIDPADLAAAQQLDQAALATSAPESGH